MTLIQQKKKKKSAKNIHDTELLAIKEALVWRLNSSYDRVLLMTDSMTTVSLPNSTSSYLGAEMFLFFFF